VTARRTRPWHYYLRSTLFVVVLATAWLVPRRGQRWLSWITARCIVALAPRLRRRLAKNLSRAMDGERDPARLRAATYRVLEHYGQYLLDFLAMRVGRGAKLRRGTPRTERLREAAAHGRGVILATAHLGSWEMAARFLADEARSVTLVSVPEEIGYLGALRSSIRAGFDHDEVLLGGDPMAALALLEKLRQGGLVGMQLDRVAGDRFSSVPFCGARLKMPRGPARLAHATGAPIVPVFALFTDDGHYELVIEEPLDPAGLDEDEIQRRLAALLESKVRAYPDQWLMMQDPWDDALPSSEPRPKSSRSEATAGAVA
jgi:KDO2-lipid IV(A) lauroyltransferase